MHFHLHPFKLSKEKMISVCRERCQEIEECAEREHSFFNPGAVAQIENIPHRIASSLCLNIKCFYYLVCLFPLPMERERLKKGRKIELILLILANPNTHLKENRKSYCQIIYNHSCSQYLDQKRHDCFCHEYFKISGRLREKQPYLECKWQYLLKGQKLHHCVCVFVCVTCLKLL